MKKRIDESKILIGICIAVLVLILVIIGYVITSVHNGKDDNNSSNGQNSIPVSSQSSSVESTAASSAEVSTAVSSSSNVSVSSETAKTNNGLDPEFSNLLLVNGENPLPADYDYGGNLITIPDKYKNGQLNEINKDVWPYMKAMLEKAWEDGVDLKVWSPYRSYSTQEMLFENQVQREMNKGLARAAAEVQAATVVARPSTSEHHTGLAADFNMASDSFENTEMYTWMKENAEDYGFIMRYSAEKQPITGVIHESWHWRFVGINHAKEINKLGMCLEEYLEHIGETES